MVGVRPASARLCRSRAAVFGAVFAGVLPAIEDPGADLIELMDAALDQIGSGISL